MSLYTDIETMDDGVISFTNFSLQNVKAYLNIYKTSLDSFGTEVGHHSIVLDVGNETTDEEHPIGLMVHLVIPKRDENQLVDCAVHRYNKKSDLLLRSIYLGIATFPNKVQNLRELRTWFVKRFERQFIQEHCNGNFKWCSDTNCHKYSAFVVSQLGLEWPEGFKILNDYPSWTIDLVSFYRDTILSSHSSS
ncbi:hypothetical protein PPL_06777 [Heterostelium album PN500]|uniref:Uncharacterized protein n=1 Tax=Heterostelium pallidum (strain ATCC 26659 / Pp 5 / PN500) TaxID=670386 RepID=D3BFP2_HETP5|nr:hypothetical protein PPL_06777 [Heterostelium album PN500]EFA79956.1 hypothetical protein PPL_06777 [Heterostelium album PN500]|eukprot:XP_020432076.1 hypothetical protein PPL_06777 [Heterostelium album PN500]